MRSRSSRAYGRQRAPSHHAVPSAVIHQPRSFCFGSPAAIATCSPGTTAVADSRCESAEQAPATTTWRMYTSPETRGSVTVASTWRAGACLG